MRRIILALAVAGLALLALAAVAFAAGPGRGPAAGGGQGAIIEDILGLDQAQVQEQRRDGTSLADMAEAQGIDPQQLITALTERWDERITVRVENGALNASEAAQLRTQLETRARDVVYRTTTGGMQGAAVGAGRGAGTQGNGAGAGAAARGNGAGAGACDGTGPHGTMAP